MKTLICHPEQYNWLREFGGSFKGKRVLVTGATGFVGCHLCDALVSLGAIVFGASLDNPPERDLGGIQEMRADLCQKNDIHEVLGKSKPDLVYHLAGLVDTRQNQDLVFPTLENNLISTLYLLTQLTETKCRRIVVIGSSETPEPGTAPNSPYAASKLAMTAYAEMFHQLFNLPLVIARPHMIYGPRQPKSKLIPYIITSFQKNIPPMLSSGKRICDPIFISDFIRALLLMGSQITAVGNTFDIGTGQGVSIRQIAETIASLMGVKGDNHWVFEAIPDRYYETPQIADITNTRAILGWNNLWTLQEGLRDTIEWYKQEAKIHELSK